MTTPPTVPQIFVVALRLGCTSFGGPVAHLGYFRREYVERRGWISAEDYAEVVALCQFLPGPASSQTGFALGYRWRGWAGGFAAWLGFTLPSAALVIALALGLTQVRDVATAGWMHGLKLAAVAVVGHAVGGMWRQLAPEVARSALVLAAAAALLWWPAAWMQLVVIALGALAGLALGAPAAANPPRAAPPPTSGALGALLGFAALLVGLPLAVRLAPSEWMQLADSFYRAGALVFGGGHVVLPLLERAVVAPGWVAPEQFLAGYGAAQAMPGPLFTFAAYLGAVQHGALGGAWALAWIFLPGLLLVPAALPMWERLRSHPRAQALLRGANAAVVGVLLAAFVSPVSAPALASPASAAVALGAWAALQFTRAPSWLVVLACAAAGALLGAR